MLTADQHRNALEAELKLAEMDVQEELADLHRTETCPHMRLWFAGQYRAVIGVRLERRSELRTALEHLAGTGQRAVADVVAGYAD